ncbi:aldehyde dehydrogenase family protein [Aquibacillus rhizosphaerae]|uniref:Aldehyde dehydrogenase family protein n=1 Tax=Aquibacillus rhizosphaerae TaxID=3051431 RepID=A0ABT7L0M1_9BACI|nr:aldehyde dehydrogenase family protein [Aquibacillus sp. LR5S19]MDL4839327.1 aldehyde dehydrogenase family protein [Aquibacillus sp. LR5S19]
MEQQFTKQYINGEWINGSSNSVVHDLNPYTQKEITSIPSANEADVNKAYQAASNAQEKWEQSSPAEKQEYFLNLINVFKKRKEEIIDWLVAESGSTRTKATIEFNICFEVIKEAHSFPTRMTGTILPSNTPGKENFVYRNPKGVIGVIGPWNFPLYLTMRSVAPAVATGNTVVIKPASDTPVTSGALIASLFEEAGFPKGVINVLVGRGSEIGDSIITHPIPTTISFTGSTEVGSHLAQLAGKDLKDTALELGGNNAMMVLEDANIDEAVQAAIFGKFLHQGEICMAINRIIVDEKVHDQFVEKFTEQVKKLKVGDPNDPNTFVGPLINNSQVERILEDVAKTKQEGAKVVTSGEVNGNLIDPIVLTDVTNDMTMAKNEIFGPVAVIIKVKNEQGAIKVANDTPYGLSGSVFTKDRWRGLEVAKQINTGMIHVNDQSVNDEPHVAFGGEKHSGLGRFGGSWALDKFTTEKWISVQADYRNF